jgi:hypothetical protein
MVSSNLLLTPKRGRLHGDAKIWRHRSTIHLMEAYLLFGVRTPKLGVQPLFSDGIRPKPSLPPIPTR